VGGLAATIAILCASSAHAGVNHWTTSGPDGGGTSCVAIDPTNPDVVYAGTSRVQKSQNSGQSWNDPSNGELAGAKVHSLAVHPTQPSTISAGTASGILRSTDGGASWSHSLASRAIYNIIFASQHKAYAADYDDASDYPSPSILYKSSDDGTTWTAAPLPFVIMPRTLVVAPTQPLTLYAAVSLPSDFAATGFHLFKSLDGGVTWSELSVYVTSALVMDPLEPATLYAGSQGGVFKTRDSGSTWTFSAVPGLAESFVLSLAIDPHNIATLYAGTLDRGVFRSMDGGASWIQFNDGLEDSRIIALAIDPTGTRLHAVKNGNVFNDGEWVVSDYQIFSGALDLTVGRDDTQRLLFTDTQARLAVRSVDGAGNPSSVGLYGPFRGWFPGAAADGSDGLTRVLWNHLNGSTALWLVGSSRVQAYGFGPQEGWTAVDVAAEAPGVTHVLWTHTDNRTRLWTVDDSGNVFAGPTLGPYASWSAAAIADGADGLTRLLWNKIDGSAGLSLVGPGGLLVTYRYGVSAGWRAVDVAVGTDGQARILWTNGDGRTALWRIDHSGNVTARGPVYEAPDGFRASHVAAGPDGLTRVLWNDLNGSALLWQMSADNVYERSFPVSSK
jgi:photosystem II stability/assembly factor-like uncharacterized protein